MNKNKKKCGIIQKQEYSSSHTTDYFTDWYEAITSTFNKLDLSDTESIEIKLYEKDKYKDMS